MVVVEDLGTVVVDDFGVPPILGIVVVEDLATVVGAPTVGFRAPFFVSNVVSLGAALPPHDVKPKITTTGTRANFMRLFMRHNLDLPALLLRLDQFLHYLHRETCVDLWVLALGCVLKTLFDKHETPA